MEVNYVTTLADSGEGSIRELIKKKVPQIIRFSVAGVIHLTERLWIGNPYITIDGSTAPGPVIFYGETVYIRTNDVIIKYITVLGNRADKVMDAMWVTKSYNVLIQNCTVLYGSDETLSVTASDYVTIENCIISSPLDINDHAFGSILDGIDNTSTVFFKHNLITNCASRNPSFGDGNFFMTGNLIYNYGHNASYTSNTVDKSVIIMMNNYYKPGPDTKYPHIIFSMPPEQSQVCLYVDNNFIDGYPAETTDNLTAIRRPEHGFITDYDGERIKIDAKKYLQPIIKGLSKAERKQIRRANKDIKRTIKKRMRVLSKISRFNFVKKEIEIKDFNDLYNNIDTVGNSLYRTYLDDDIVKQMIDNTGFYASHNVIDFAALESVSV